MRMMIPKKRLMMGISQPPELQREDGLDGLELVAAFEAQAGRVIRIDAVGRVFCQLGFDPLGRALGGAVAEKHRDGLFAPVTPKQNDAPILAIEADDIQAQQVGNAFDQIDVVSFGFSSAY
jgi:hypothetical protein